MYVFNDKQRFYKNIKISLWRASSARSHCRDDLRPSFYEINTRFERDEANK